MIAQSLKVHVDNEFYILSYLGKDLPGALVVEPMEPEVVPENVLTTHGKAKAVRFDRIVQGNKFSLAGVLASAVGLPVAEAQLHKNNNNYYLLIKRFDRIFKNHKIKRLHQEDFCQALGIGYDKKYQQDGGPSFQACYHLIQQVSMNPIKDVDNLLRWQIFNILAGNSDGHAKNLSILYKENHQAELAPFYDLVCTRAIERIDTKLALSIGEEFNPDKITLDHWNKMAFDCNINKAYLKKMIEELAEKLLFQMPIMEEKFEAQFGAYPALQRIRKVVNKQCKRALKQLHNTSFNGV